jgi:hypothetical protein
MNSYGRLTYPNLSGKKNTPNRSHYLPAFSKNSKIFPYLNFHFMEKPDMKRIIAVLLVLVLTFWAFGCSPKKDAKTGDQANSSPISQRNNDLENATGE